MKYKYYFIRLAIVLVAAISAISCADDNAGSANQQYGYLQIFLVKNTTRVTTELNYLSDACKIRVNLIAEDGSRVSQTLNITPYANTVAEYGTQSEKCQMLAGKYKVSGFELFDNLDISLYSHDFDTQDQETIEVTPGGLMVHKIDVDAVGRGTLKFRLIKDNALPTRTGGVQTYPFHMITWADVTVKNLDNNVKTEIKKLKVSYKDILSADDATHITAVSETDSLVRLPAGRYTVTGFKTYFGTFYIDVANLIEVNDAVVANEFRVIDNQTIIADVPVTLEESAEYIKDAYALKAIWEALDGPNWSYRGVVYPAGSNWRFEGRDIDMWLAQPGVELHPNGRIAVINFAGFGARGEVPAAIGQLTDLRILYLGTHNDDPAFPITRAAGLTSKTVTEGQLKQHNKDLLQSFTQTYSHNGHVLESFSKELQEGFEINNVAVNGVPFKKSATPIKKLPTVTAANYVTNITKLPAEMGLLTKLESLYVAFSPLADLPIEMKNCTALTTIELFGCPNMQHIPTAIAEMPTLVVLVFVSNEGVTAANLYSDLQYMNTKAASIQPKGSYLQQLFVPAQKLERVPDLRNLKSLNLLNISGCGVEEFEAPFGKDFLFMQFNASNNKISSLPVDASGVFVGMHSDMEQFDFSNNEFTEFPNIFSAKSIFTLSSINFARNKITKLQGADDNTWKGINVSTLSLGYNLLEKFPTEFYTMDKETCSSISFLQIQGNKIDEIPEDALKGLYTSRLTTLDISVNKLTKLPTTFNAETFPYLYGLDLSYNRFTLIQTKPLNSATLTVYLFRGQRDENGNRCMREWLSGIGQHTGLRALYLGSNDIRTVNDGNLSYMIYNLEISDNPNIVIDVTSLCPYITAGYFRLAYDRTQDIRGCEALKINK